MQDNARFSPLGEELQNWVQEQLQLLREYARQLEVSDTHSITDEWLDELWLSWKQAAISDSKAVDSFLNAFGIGFGQVLVNSLGFDWTYLEDEYGADIAVRALPGSADTRIAPLHFVLKRWESNEGEYVKAAVEEIDQIVREQALDHGVQRDDA
ncbi:MAG: DUF3806 domain-containing protein [Pseudomonadota bacterium]